MYLNERRGSVTAATLYSHDSRLGHFTRWCDEKDIDDVAELSGYLIHSYRQWRRADGDLCNVTVKTQMDTLRVFVKFLERIDAVEDGLAEKVESPSLNDGENERDVMLEAERAREVLDYLRTYRYASKAHVLVHLFWQTAMRMGTLRALDLGDFDADNARLAVENRQEETYGIVIATDNTPLKNGPNGERYIAIRQETVGLLDDWIEYERHDVTDSNGREPLITTAEGRISRTCVRDTLYRITRPCEYGQPCPHDRDLDECEAVVGSGKTASKCPSSRSPHPVRRGSITHRLSDDVPEKVVSDRCDVSEKVLEKHYDRRTEEQKVEQRREYL